MTQPDDVLAFWFDGLDTAEVSLEQLEKLTMKWFAPNPELDRTVAERFGDLMKQAADGKLDSWAATAAGRLALVVLLDQFSRNVHRGKGESFANDPRALRVVREGMERGADKQLTHVQRFVFYMPLMHAEDKDVQRQSLACFSDLVEGCDPALKPSFAEAYEYAQKHAEIVERFGRYPHRNKLLGRDSTAQELEFLKQPGSSF